VQLHFRNGAGFAAVEVDRIAAIDSFYISVVLFTQSLGFLLLTDGIPDGRQVNRICAGDLFQLPRLVERCAGFRRSQHGFAAVEVDQLRTVLANDGKARRSGFRADCIAGDVSVLLVDVVTLIRPGQRIRGSVRHLFVCLLDTRHHALCAIDKALNGGLCALHGLVVQVHVGHTVGHVLRDLVHGIAHAGFEVGHALAGGFLRLLQGAVILDHLCEVGI